MQGGPRPRITQRAFEVNPSPGEIAVGALEQWRRSKLSRAWKNVLVSLVKGTGQQQEEQSLCVWRQVISTHDGSNALELLQQIPVKFMQHVDVCEYALGETATTSIHAGGDSLCRFTVVLSNASEELTFRCLDEPEAVRDWVTTLRTVIDYMHVQSNKNRHKSHSATTAAAKPTPEVNLLSFDETTRNNAHAQTQPNLLSGMGHPPQQHHQQQQFRGASPAYSHNHNMQPTASLWQAQHHQHQQRYPTQQSVPYNSTGHGIPQYSYQMPQATKPTPVFDPLKQPNNRHRSVTPPPRQYHTTHAAAAAAQPHRIPRPHNSNSNAQHHHQQRPQQPRPHHTPTRSHSAPPATTSNARHAQIKQQVLMEWALQPPAYQHLQPLSELIRTLPRVFPPPAVANHDYFAKWQQPNNSNNTNNNNTAAAAGHAAFANQGELDKAVRKLKFLLHPDKIPKDFNSDQSFLCKMLWDIINDAVQLQQQQQQR